jgi:pimeloyl-ACP methyl ester carboxylesterase
MQQSILEDPISVLRRMDTPTLLLWGKKDRLIPFSNASDYSGALPHASLVQFPDLGHVPHEEAPDAALEPLERFLAQ